MFQRDVNIKPSGGWHGDFASINPHVSLLGADGAYQAGKGGVLAGSFVWADDDSETVFNQGEGTPDGFVAREMTSTFTNISDGYTMLVPEGFMVTVYEGGEFLVIIPEEIATVTKRSSVFVDPNTGLIVDESSTGAVDSGYKYTRNGKTGDLIAISSWIKGEK